MDLRRSPPKSKATLGGLVADMDCRSDQASGFRRVGAFGRHSRNHAKGWLAKSTSGNIARRLNHDRYQEIIVAEREHR
jgi:hypothetical protein